MNASLSSWLPGIELHLWQASLFALVVSFGLPLLSSAPARLRHLAASLALLRFLVPIALTGSLALSLPWSNHGGHWLAGPLGDVWMPAFIVGGSGAPASETASVLPSLLVGLWVAGAALVFGVGLLRLARGLRPLHRHSTPFAPEEQCRLDRLAARAGLKPGRVTGFHVPSNSWLGVVGLLRSRVIVPEGLLSELEDQEADAMLLHELMHVRRRDNLLRFLQAGAVALFWFHPLVWWLDRRLRWESERACDEGVLRITGANHAYASGLFKATRFALGLSLPGVSGMSRQGLPLRLRAVLNHQNDKDSPVKNLLVAGALVGLFGLASLVASTPTTTAAVAADNDSAGSTLSSDGAARQDVYDYAELTQQPKLLQSVPPKYPFEMKRTGSTGEVVVVFIVDTDGQVVDPDAAQSSNKAFAQAAVDAVRQWKFSPGMKDGRVVKVRMAVPIVFSLSKK